MRLFDKYYPLRSLCHQAKLYLKNNKWHCKKCHQTAEAYTNGVKT